MAKSDAAIRRTEYWDRTQRRDYFEKGVEVKAGEAVNVVFHIMATKPIPDPVPNPVRLPIPVEAERQGAARIRQFGGNYSLDAENHVVDVIMVKYESMSVRNGENVWSTLVNDITDTDEGLRTANAFPRLKRLILNKGQATDDGLKSLATLANLEFLFIENSPITAAGVGHLTGLKQLKNLDLRDGQLVDDSLAELGKMRQLRSLSIGGNSFSDDGLKHLADLKELRSLSLGFNRPPLTDAGVKHLAGLTTLVSLDLQMSQLSDAGVVALKDMKQLQRLLLNGTKDAAPVTDACVDHLLGLTKLKVLWMQNSRLTEQGVLRLLALPDLKELNVAITTNPAQLRKDIQKKRPDVQVHISGPPDKE